MNPCRTNHQGFVLPMLLGIALLAALLAAHSAAELSSTMLLANQRQLHHYAFEAAEGGLAVAVEQLGTGATPTPTQTLRMAATAATATVTTVITGQLALPAGYSTGRVIATQYEITSTGHGARSSDVTVTQGVRQLRAAEAP
jgi:Tfp pilus assembly protein PilX